MMPPCPVRLVAKGTRYPGQVLVDAAGIVARSLAQPGEGERAGKPAELAAEAGAERKIVAGRDPADERIPGDDDQAGKVQHGLSGRGIGEINEAGQSAGGRVDE